MADYWKSNPKKYCDICKCWIQDNAISRNNHESGQRHIGNVQKKLNELRKNANASPKRKMREKISLISDKAFVGMMKDIERDPSVAKRYGVDLSGEQLGKMKDKLKNIQEKQKDKKVTQKKPTLPAAISPSMTKPIIYEWKEVKTNDGRVYYWNKRTGATQWDRPKASIQPSNDSECVSQEKKRLDQFLFNRLVELSESGSSEASTAVCQAFGASNEKNLSSLETKKEDIAVPDDPGTNDEFVKTCSSNDILPRINLLGEWEPVNPEEKAISIVPDCEQQEMEPVEQDNEIKIRLTSMARKTLKCDEAKLQEISEKAELLSHLSEISEANISSECHLKFEEKQAAVSTVAKKAVQKFGFRFKPDPDVKIDTNVSPSPITFKRKSSTCRNLRNRSDNE